MQFNRNISNQKEKPKQKGLFAFYLLIYQIFKNSLAILKSIFLVPQLYQTHENIG
jgi:hypothetical protein